MGARFIQTTTKINVSLFITLKKNQKLLAYTNKWGMKKDEYMK